MSLIDQMLAAGSQSSQGSGRGTMTLQQLLAMQGASVWNPDLRGDSEAGGGDFQPQVGVGWMSALGNLPDQDYYVPGAIENAFDQRMFQEYMRRRGFTAAEVPLGGNKSLRGVFDAQGNPVVPVEEFQVDDDRAFWNMGLLAMGVTGANIGLAGGAAGTTTTAPSANTATSATTGATTGTTAGTTGGSGLAGGGFLDASALGTYSAGTTPTMASVGTGGYGSAAGYGAAGGGAGAAGYSAAAPAAAPAAGTWGAKEWGSAIESGLGLYSSLYGMNQADKAAAAMDPFGPYRARYAQLLSELEANPRSVQRLPGFQAGLSAIENSTAAGGYFGSGNAAAALTEFGGNFYQQEASRLAQLAGAGATPGAGALGALDVKGQSLAGAGYSIAQLLRLYGGG